jgi:cell division transport system ATP-binding protein
MIDLKHVSVEYSNGIYGLHDISLTIEPGEFTFVMGNSGSGKSTLSKLIHGDCKPSKGNAFVNGYNIATCNRRELAEMRRSVGMVYQDYKLISSMSVRENLEFATRCINMDRNTMQRRIDEVAEITSLSSKLDRMPSELSGGEQQRVAIARAIINRPYTVVADEPTANLDPALAENIMCLFEDINAAYDSTVIVITHAEEMLKIFSPIRVITIADGFIKSDGIVTNIKYKTSARIVTEDD